MDVRYTDEGLRGLATDREAKREPARFDPAALRAALPKLRDLTLAEDFGQAIVDIAADAGVVVIVDPAPHEPAAGE